MKIEKFKKKKNNIYEIILSDNTSLSFYDDTILKHNLLLKKEIDNKKLKEIIEYNTKLDAYYKVIAYINKKLRTKKEIIYYLKRYNYTNEQIDYAIEKLINNNYLNDTLYIKSYINDQINLTLKGPKKIIMELEKLGFNNSDINCYLDSFNDGIWKDKINIIVNKKIKINHKLSKNMLLKKIKQDLLTQGYYAEQINDVIDNIDIDENDIIIEKEYDKLFKKLSCKYSNEKIFSVIRYELIKKGFNIEKINNIIYKKKIHN